uniref:Uncharacterized protein n=1 Tax=Eustigmatophyceae sp. Chic 10/23 P-6w TaxID=1446905 RepID=A0A3R5V1I8_9STRA|nr:hypothetical protein [Eustigmatophyceae sp. Chic 10/23 P-6w]QAA11636.1 hypothetical protein [Eustigmatophyceae sp. Chic 10/23 P-6w]
MKEYINNNYSPQLIDFNLSYPNEPLFPLLLPCGKLNRVPTNGEAFTCIIAIQLKSILAFYLHKTYSNILLDGAVLKLGSKELKLITSHNPPHEHKLKTVLMYESPFRNLLSLIPHHTFLEGKIYTNETAVHFGSKLASYILAEDKIHNAIGEILGTNIVPTSSKLWEATKFPIKPSSHLEFVPWPFPGTQIIKQGCGMMHGVAALKKQAIFSTSTLFRTDVKTWGQTFFRPS